MIYTVTFNPSLDYFIRVDELEKGTIHRAQEEDIFAGGKGINVSIVLQELGVDSVALGFAAGFTGNEIIQRIRQKGISADFISVSQGVSRINVKIRSGISTETDINGQGPEICASELQEFYHKLNQLKNGDFLVLSGSVPKSIANPEQVYQEICRKVIRAQVRLVIDAEGELLRNTLKEKPFLIKPNRQELEGLFGKLLTSRDSIILAAKQLQKEGAENVLVSLGGEGAIFVDPLGNVYEQAAPAGKPINSVGAGDSMVAGFLAGLVMEPGGNSGDYKEFTHRDYLRALRWGSAAGGAAAFSVGLPDKNKIESVYASLK